jgi:hypothetical protein
VPIDYILHPTTQPPEILVRSIPTLVMMFAVTSPLVLPRPALAQADAAPQIPLPPGMTPLFDGKSLTGWTAVPADSWVVKDGGILASKGAARGVIYTTGQYDRYRVMFDVRHIRGDPDHRAGVLVFCSAPKDGEEPMDALGGIQFQVPNGGSWDYRKGKNNNGKDLFTRLVNPKFDEHQWSRVEILVDATSGTARMAVAQPVGAKAVEVLRFKDPTAGQKGLFALQMHNKNLFDEFANIAVEENPKTDDLITTRQ